MSSGPSRLRGDYERETTAPAVWLVCALAGVFVIQFSLELASGGAGGGLAEGMALSGEALRQGRWWTPLTFWLPHSTSNLFHVGLVIAGVLLLGRDLLGRLKPRMMLAVFGLGLLAGAVWWTAINWARPTGLIGATAGVYALLVLAARLSPDREFRFLLLFLTPVSFRLRQLVWALFAVEVLAFVLNDLVARPLPFDYAAASHLGGMAAGWIAGRRLAVRGEIGEEETSALPPQEAPPEVSSPRSSAELRAEVDRVLDKISARGLGALTPDERRILDEAKHLLDRR
ncbi:MAG: rhomboid family intramembrane serine protease [Opitutaceae bacterium]|nr:rhomboid family intramembrane serine protease [Opitutaceae bacterium]